ncbi:NAD(P)-dependent oxidoreductase [Roseomonas sp. CAU 1739]|uniref:NAD(P)-dependent oxidoreductase n=1 Tax=Roseomonas sp. CAU 1739 TaxID=3140364 RepID=UPI00325AA89F
MTRRLRVFLSHTAEQLPDAFAATALDALQDCADVVFNRSGVVLAGRDLAEAAADCQAIIAHRATPGLAETFAAAPDLVAFLRAAVDVSTIDLAAASAQGVLVTRVSPGFNDAVAELGLGMMIDLARGVSRAATIYRAGGVPRAMGGVQLKGAALGIAGYGRIARRLAEIATGLGMKVLACDPHAAIADAGVEAVPFATMLARSDFIVCLAASTPETAGLFGAHAFQAMKRGAIFINLSRGELVDEAALEAALDRGHLRGAGLDVGSAPDQMPSPRLACRTDVVATPHIGGTTREARAHQAMHTVKQVSALGEARLPEGAINPAAAYRLGRLKPATSEGEHP